MSKHRRRKSSNVKWPKMAWLGFFQPVPFQATPGPTKMLVVPHPSACAESITESRLPQVALLRSAPCRATRCNSTRAVGVESSQARRTIRKRQP